MTSPTTIGVAFNQTIALSRRVDVESPFNSLRTFLTLANTIANKSNATKTIISIVEGFDDVETYSEDSIAISSTSAGPASI